MPIEFKKNLGELNPIKNNVDGYQLVSWDYIDPCKGDKCPAFDRCNSDKYGKCGIHVLFLDSFVTTFKGITERKNTDRSVAYRVGMHLIPLYRTLWKLYILELGVEEMILVNNKGGFSIHPVYDAINKTLDYIEKMWLKMGLTGINYSLTNPLSKSSSIPSNYYEAMENGSFGPKSSTSNKDKSDTKPSNKSTSASTSSSTNPNTKPSTKSTSDKPKSDTKPSRKLNRKR